MTPPLKDALLAIGTGAVGVFFLANGIQEHFGENLFGQRCIQPIGLGICFHPEWIGIGAGLVALAVYAWRRASDRV